MCVPTNGRICEAIAANKICETMFMKRAENKSGELLDCVSGII